MILFLLLAPAASGTWADDTPPDPDLSTEGMRHLGSFYVRPTFLLKDVGYDDNVYLAPGNDAVSDYTATGGGRLDALLLTGNRGGIYLSGEGDYVAYQDQTNLNHWNGYARARGIYLAKRAVLSLEDGFVSVLERPNFEVDDRSRRHQNDITGAVRSRSDHRVGYSAYVRHRDIEYSRVEGPDDDVASRLNRQEGSFSLAGELRIRPKTTFVLEGVFENVEFDDPTELRDTRSVSVLPGFRFDPSAAIQGEFKIGVISLDALDRPQSDYDGAVGEGRISTRLGSRARVKLTYKRDLPFSTFQENLYFLSNHWTAAYEHFFSRRVSGEILYGQGTNDYPEDVTFTGGEPFSGHLEEDITRYTMSMGYRVNDQLWIRLQAQRTERDSTDDFRDRTRNFYTVGSTYAF